MLGSLLCLCIGLYKLKTEVCSCDEQHHGSQDVGEKRKRKSLTLQEAINRSRDLATRIKDEIGSPGLAVSVSVDGREVWSEGLGYADVENRVPCSTDTIMRIGSISKAISMVAVAKQLEAGTLDLDKPVQHYVPNFPEKIVDGKKVIITTRHLVSHLGGIRHYHSCIAQDTKPTDTDNSSKNTHNEAVKKPNTGTAVARQPEKAKKEYFISDHYNSVTDSMNLFKDDPLVHEPGTKYLYSSHGFTLLSAVIEAVAKTPFDKLMKEYFVQMGMDSTFLDENTPLIYNRGRHYTRDKKGRLINTPYVDLSYKWASGGFLSSTRDLNKFGGMMLYSYQNNAYDKKGQSSKLNLTNQESKDAKTSHLDDEKRNAIGFLKRESVELLWKPVDKAKCTWNKSIYYGMGWAVVPPGENFGQCHHSDHLVSHIGNAIGSSSVLLIKPRKCLEKGGQPQGVVVAMVVNMRGANLYKTAARIAKLFEEADT
ncbi:serine beta-lactamase-like protein LACTB, mitochondrial [Argopecten irradians]|uniref:serine beta-lactamase-like protein LACTB, mitochondrial n=1 Tax=Argopecten irradians TaxID=31199 RepID=UPI003710A8A5